MAKKKQEIPELEYYASIKQITNIENFKQEFELWINSNIDFLILWEQIFNDDTFEFNYTDYIKLDDWIKVAHSVIVDKNDVSNYFVHPHILLAYALEDPVIKINLLVSIFELPKKQVDKFLTNIFNF